MTEKFAKEDRAEMLGKKLLKYYGMTWRWTTLYDATKLLQIKLKGAGIYWDDWEAYPAESWYDLLFSCAFRRSRWHDMTFNQYVCKMVDGEYPSYKKVKAKLLDFKTLDELDVLLTLAGVNTVSETEAV